MLSHLSRQRQFIITHHYTGDQEGLFKLVTLNCILNRITGVTFGLLMACRC
jgi:hypothetical protein